MDFVENAQGCSIVFGMRLAFILCLFAMPASAWEFTSSPTCTLRHSTAKADLEITFSARASALYFVEITQNESIWRPGPIFTMGFDGPRRSMISTDRHTLGAEGKSLRVTDSGIGNLLDGIEFNFVALARSGDTALTFSLTGAASAVRRFRACVASPEL